MVGKHYVCGRCGFSAQSMEKINSHFCSNSTRQQAHYTQHKIQPVCFIGENKMDFLAGNVIKYVSRYNLKNGVEDLEKARHYLDMLIQRERGEVIKP